MYSHIARSQTRSWLGSTRYRLTAKIHPTPQESLIIERHRLHRMEIFYDPFRDRLSADATAAHAKAKARGLFTTKARDAAAICASEACALTATVRACLAFNITVADLCHGITITHRSLETIGEIERVLSECVDAIDRSVQAAASYADDREDIFAPGTEDERTVPPAEWARAWRR